MPTARSKGRTPRLSVEGVGLTDMPIVVNGPGGSTLRRGDEARPWASRKMQSYAPAYETICVHLVRRTPADVLSDAADQAQQEAIARMKRR